MNAVDARDLTLRVLAGTWVGLLFSKVLEMSHHRMILSHSICLSLGSHTLRMDVEATLVSALLLFDDHRMRLSESVVTNASNLP